jgi:hypothetical protein
MDVRLPDGTVIKGVPDGMSKADLTAKLKSNGYDVSKLVAASAPDVSDSSAVGLAAGLGKGFGTVALNAQKYVGKGLDAIGADSAGQWLVNDADQGLKKISGEVAPYKEKSPIAAGTGELGGEIVATLPVGGVLGKLVQTGARGLGVGTKAAPLVSALSSSGFRAGAANPTINMLTRAAGGAATGGVSAGLVNPDDVGTGAAIGAALPPVLGVAGKAGQLIGKGLRGGEVSPEVANLASRAKDLGIDIPADRLVDSKPLNALASSLNYVPFSGRAATETKMQSQLNKALSRTFGQNSDNVTGALRKAGNDLGQKFDDVLSNNVVNVDNQFLSDLASHEQKALNELGPDQAQIIKKQIDQLLDKGANGQIDGQAAYNIKKTLDRIGNRNSPEAYYARDLKKSLMEALNRSLSPDDSKAFAKTRQEYGNMLALEKLAQNGAEGDISIGRLANLKNIGNKDLQELADIAAQFLKSREGSHGAAQRTVAGAAAAMLGGPATLAAGIAGGRGANMLLNSQAGRDFVMPTTNRLANGINPLLGTGLYRSAPLLGVGE